MTESSAVIRGVIFNLLLFPFCAAVSRFFCADSGAVLFGSSIAQLFSLSYFGSLLLLRFLPFQLTMLPVFGGFLFRLVFLSFAMLAARALFPDALFLFAASFGIVTAVTLVFETIIILRIGRK